MNTWTFSGTITRRTRKTTAKGKPFFELVITQPDGQYPKTCACTFWHSDAPDEGQRVMATGEIDSREYQGRYYPGLTCRRLEVDRSVTPAPAAPPARVSAPTSSIKPPPPDPQPALPATPEAGEIPF